MSKDLLALTDNKKHCDYNLLKLYYKIIKASWASTLPARSRQDKN